MDPEVTAIQKIQDNGNQPEEWLEFLFQHQAKDDNTEHTTETCQHLVFLYERAVNQISSEKHKLNLSYAQLLVEFAKLQMKISEDDARRTFQLARSNAKNFAIVFVAWAQFELSLGNKSKCRGLLRKGKDVGAKPIELLIKAYDNFLEGKKVLIGDSDDLMLSGFSRPKHRSSESSLDSSPLSQADDSSTGSRFTDKGISAIADNTSAVISFKLPSILENCGNQPISCRQGTSSSSDDTDTVPLPRARYSMSTQKPPVKSTPDFRTGKSSIVSGMNLSVRSNKARRLPGRTGIDFGLPKRVKMPQSSMKEPSDDLDGITELECTVDDSQLHGNTSEIKTAPQENHTTANKAARHTVSCSSEKILGTEQNIGFGTSLSSTAVKKEFSSNGTRNNGSVLRKGEDQSSNQQSNVFSRTTQDGVEQRAPMSHSASLHGNKRQPQAEVPLHSHRNTQEQQIPLIPQTQKINISNSVGGESDIMAVPKQSSGSLGSLFTSGGSLMQPHMPQVSNGGQLKVIPGQSSGIGPAHGYPPAMQLMNTSINTPAQVSQDSVVVKGKSYLRLGVIGKGGSSKVYRAFDGKKIFAMKFVNLEEADDFMVQSYFNEIDLLNRLQGNDNIIKLFDWELKQETRNLILVMEYGSIDLAGFLRKNRSKMTKADRQVFWQQMLEAVHLVHQQGIIHRDLKPANFLLVDGRLKLIDFGIAHTLQTDKTSIELDTQVGTLNFMSPEAFQDISQAPRFDNGENTKPRLKIGRPSDVWSLGCILYMMVYGRSPFQHINNHFMKLQCIMDPSHQIDFPPINDVHLLDVIKGCLRRNPKERLTIPDLLDHPFLNSLSHDEVIDCVMQIVNLKSDVNSPRSIRNLCKQHLAGKNINLSSTVPNMNHGPVQSHHAIPPRQAPVRQPLMGVDAQALNRAQRALKPPHVSGSEKYMNRDTNEQNKENADLRGILRRELDEKYRNAIPRDISESTFEQSWNTTVGR
ncbi:dual specificity protein kinase TTK-like isoform X1 [Acropora palmata]|uniref:dual specificity protein kinase TTK-like isoform X1 n=1 Tax=Acropora palmata TaxID=6131 RepID=UPI003D9FDF66